MGERRNFVLILCDDLGWNELGCYGNAFNETPHLDALAAEGMRFTQAYAASTVCSPSRAALLTGQHPVRCGITDYLRPASRNHLPRGKVTLAQALGRTGYATGIVGKWHLSGYVSAGLAPHETYMSAEAGFDEVRLSEVVGIGDGSYFHPYNRVDGSIAPHPGLRRPGEPEYLTDRLNLEAVEFIQRHRDEPFFLFLSHYAVHTSLAAPEATVAHFRGKAGAGPCVSANRGEKDVRNNPLMAAMVRHVDDGVGMIRRTLRELGIGGRTVIIFTSDNGGQAGGTQPVTDLSPLREGKSFTYEGGIREPLIVLAPGLTPAGAVCEAPTINMDFYPTLLELAGVAAETDGPLDGVSLVPALRGQPDMGRELYWHYPHDHFLGGRASDVILKDGRKLVRFLHEDRCELYDLGADISEQRDLSGEMPDVTRDLAARLAAWRRSMSP